MLRVQDIDGMSEPELRDFLGDLMCAHKSCFNLSAHGVIYCESCLYGEPQKAEDDLIYAKKRLARLQSKAPAKGQEKQGAR